VTQDTQEEAPADELPANVAPAEEPVADFDSGDVETPADITATVKLGGRIFTMTCPKDVFWENAALLQARAEAAEDARAELDGANAHLIAAPRKRDLQAVIDKAPPVDELRDTLIQFVFMCLSDEDENTVRAMWQTAKKGGVTSNALYLTAVFLVRRFEEEHTKRAKNLGLEMRKRFGVAPSREERRAART